jgi:ubiquinone/menaquinone biosynthesis C-methylase UbiE
MHDPLHLNDRLFAFYYPKVCALAENAGLREIRRDLIAEASGRTLELGAGSGLNLPHYTDKVTELVITEPSPFMLEHLRTTLDEEPPDAGSRKLVQAGAEQLPFADASFDTVVATFVLCTVPSPEESLREIARVLAPGGRYLFLEHVHAGEGTMLGRFQDVVEIPHRYLAAGCHPNRRTARLIDESPLTVERLERSEQPRAIPTVRPMIIGAATVA